ncbi:VIT1/CCC1 transporter family protein [candidate division FCPU426 bacterium]|nr:VIT1/CCC1 transporter family protein [candidate division FCPU426 bacterium]
MGVAEGLKRQILMYQRSEITEYHIYQRLAQATKSPENKKVLQDIAADELRHYQVWKQHTGEEVQPDRMKILFYCWISRLLGLTFGVKLMERGEETAQDNYRQILEKLPGVQTILREEQDHEDQLLNLIDEERLQYVGSIVLGLNDALVELTGGLAGLTLALGNVRLIALSGLIVGIAAALSMAASEYLSTKSEKSGKSPMTSSVYTGVAYVATVIILILPYLFLENRFLCLAWTLTAAVAIIAAFNYYLSVSTDRPFRRHFLEMAGVSLGVAALSFGLGYVIRVFLGVEV